MVRTLLLISMLMAGAVAFFACSKDECTLGDGRCAGGNPQSCERDCSDFGCNDKWMDTDFCEDGHRTCIAPPSEKAVCAESLDPDPRCGQGETRFCDGDTLVRCASGYHTRHFVCGADDTSGSSGPETEVANSRCIATTRPGDATCIPRDAVVNPVCQGGNDARCDGSKYVQCLAGFGVFTANCGRCTNAQGAYLAQCSGFLGDICTTDAQCASGLSCHDDGSGAKSCTRACTIAEDGGAPDGGAPATNDCYASFSLGGPPFTSLAKLPIPGKTLRCIAGFCKWG